MRTKRSLPRNTLSATTSEVRILDLKGWLTDRKVNLGKWVIRNLFSRFIGEELHRDALYRKELRKALEKTTQCDERSAGTSTPPMRIEFERPVMSGFPAGSKSASSPAVEPSTPMGINLATPAATHSSGTKASVSAGGIARMPDIGENGEAGASVGRDGDYFAGATAESAQSTAGTATTFGTSATSTDTETNKSSSNFMHRLKSFSMGRRSSTRSDKDSNGAGGGTSPGSALGLSKSQQQAAATSPSEAASVDTASGTGGGAGADEDAAAGAKGASTTAPEPPKMCQSVIDEVRKGYGADNLDKTGFRIAPNDETPPIALPPHTTIILSEDMPDAGDTKDVYRGSVACTGTDASILEKVAPAWMGAVLLQVW